jgi:HEAT repeat protein
MPSPETKKNVRRFLEALLTYTSPESQGVHEEPLAINFDWKESTGRLYPLVVRTTLKELEKLVPSDPTDGKLSQNQIRLVIQKYLSEKFLGILKDNREQPKGSKYWHFTLTLWSKDTQENLEQFDKEWKKRSPKATASKTLSRQETAYVEAEGTRSLNWQEIFASMLSEQKRVSSNSLLHSNEDAKFDQEQLYTPSSLVRRVRLDKRYARHYSPLDAKELLQPQYEQAQHFEPEEFLRKILELGEGKSKGTRIALVGEAGAGKSTLLSAIAFWVLKNNLGWPIWISASHLYRDGAINLETYLFETWLQVAVPRTRRTEMEQEFTNLLSSGQVWLLLDGVDEVKTSGVDILQALSQQLVGWIGASRVVLSCRSNAWDYAGLNALEAFETYYLLDFDYPIKVHQFIDKFFKNSDKSKGERLKAKLDAPSMERLHNTVQTPLHLLLLCEIWLSYEGSLPRSRTGLYYQFIQQFYIRQKHRFLGTTSRQKELNARSFDPVCKEVLRFWIGRFDLEKETKEAILRALMAFEDGCVRIALEEGSWNLYRFRGYFLAAIACAEWEEYSCNHGEALVGLLVKWAFGYFCPQERRWVTEIPHPIRQSALAALEESDLPLVIQALIELISTLKEIELHQPEVRETHRQAVQSLVKIGRSDKKLINVLIELIEPTEDEYIRQLAINNLGQVGSGSKTVFEALVYQARLEEDGYIHRKIIESLRKIASGNEQWQATVRGLALEAQEPSTSSEVAESSREISIADETDIGTLVGLIAQRDNSQTLIYAVDRLGKIGIGNYQQAIAALVEVAQDTTIDRFICRVAINSLEKIALTDKMALAALINLTQTAQDELIRLKAVENLGKIGFGNMAVAQALGRLMLQSSEKSSALLRMAAADALKSTLSQEYLADVVTTMKRCISPEIYDFDKWLFNACFELTWHGVLNMPYPEFYQAWHRN